MWWSRAVVGIDAVSVNNAVATLVVRFYRWIDAFWPRIFRWYYCRCHCSIVTVRLSCWCCGRGAVMMDSAVHFIVSLCQHAMVMVSVRALCKCKPWIQYCKNWGKLVQYTNISSEIYVDHKRYMEEYSIYTMIYLLLHLYLPLTAKVFDLVSTSVNEKSIYCIVQYLHNRKYVRCIIY